MHRSNGGFDFWDKEKDKIIDMYVNDKMSSCKIAKIYDCHDSTIIRQLKRWDVEIRRNRYNNIYDLDERYFENINTANKAYIIGLLLTDGHLSKNGALMLTLKDLDIMEKYKKELKSNAPIRYDKYGNPTLNIVCKNFNDDLLKFGFHNRKSYKIDIDKILSFIPKEFEHHFVRGLFDGDGGIHIYEYDYTIKEQCVFQFTGLKNVCDYVYNYLELTTKYVKESDITYTIRVGNPLKIKEIFDKLYFNADIYIERKYNTFLEIIDKRC